MSKVSAALTDTSQMDVVITGSTKGIGLALTKSFLKAGDRVLISSRSQDRVESAVDTLRKQYPDQVFGYRVDISKYSSLEEFAAYAKQHFDTIDIWINNAGTNEYARSLIFEQDPQQISKVISTNLTGTVFACNAAIKVMSDQQNGHIFNMDGLGSNGRIQKYYSAYTISKRAIPYLTRSYVKETEHLPVHLHTLSPGMVLTDLLLNNMDPSNATIFNILAETPTTVAEYLVPRIRKVSRTEKEGTYIKYLTSLKAIWRFMTFWRRKNRFFDSDGNLKIDLES